MKMRPDGRSSAEERINDNEEALVPPALQPSITCRLEDDDAASGDDKTTICEIILLSLQHLMVAAARCILAVMYISPSLCLLTDDPIRGLLLARFFAVSGLTTLFHTTYLGVRLPLAHAPCVPTLVAVSLALSLTQCPSSLHLIQLEDEERARYVEPRLGEIQGALLITSLVAAAIAISARLFSRGVKRPALAAAASIAGALVALKPAADVASTCWPAALGVTATPALLALITFRKARLPLPLPACSANRGFHFRSHPIGAVAAILTVMFAWMICAILTAGGLISAESALSTSPHRLDRIYGPKGFLLPSTCWSWPTLSSGPTLPLATIVGFSFGMILNWGSWTAVLAATQPPSLRCGGGPESWKGFLGSTVSVVLAAFLGAPAPASGGADTAGVAFFAKAAGTQAVGLIPLRVCGVLLVLLSLFPSVLVAVCSVPLAILNGVSLLLIAASGGAGLLYLEDVNLRAFRLRLLFGLVLLATLTQSFYTFCGQNS